MSALKHVSLALATVTLLGAALPSAQAATLIGHDLSQPALSYDWDAPPGSDIKWTDTYDNRKAVGVTLATGTEYSLGSFTAMLALVTLAGYNQTEQTHAAVHRDDGGKPGELLASLGTRVLIDPSQAYPLVPAAPVTWTTETPVVLQGGGTYWFVLNDPTQYSEFGIPFVHWTVMQSRAAPTGVGTLAGYRYSVDGGATWNTSGVYNAVQIQVTAVPEPQALVMMLAGLGLIGVFVRRSKASQLCARQYSPDR